MKPHLFFFSLLFFLLAASTTSFASLQTEDFSRTHVGAKNRILPDFIGTKTPESRSTCRVRTVYLRKYTSDSGVPAENGMNWTGYVSGDPINMIDPTGYVGIIFEGYENYTQEDWQRIADESEKRRQESSEKFAKAMDSWVGKLVMGYAGGNLLKGLKIFDRFRKKSPNQPCAPVKPSGKDGLSLSNPDSLIGASPSEIEALIPSNWIKKPLRKGEGSRFFNPEKKGEVIMIEGGWASGENTLHGGPYLKISRDGKIIRIPLEGNPTLK